MKVGHHTGLHLPFLQDTHLMFLSGDPSRAIALYSCFDKQETILEKERKLWFGRGAVKREIEGKEYEIEVVSGTTGMSLGSNEIVVNESLEILAEWTNRKHPYNLVRLGTCGMHQPEKIFGGDLIIAQDVYAPFGTVDDLIETRHEDPNYHFEFGYFKLLERALEARIEGRNLETIKLFQLKDTFKYLAPKLQYDEEFNTLVHGIALNLRAEQSQLESHLYRVRMHLAKMEIQKVYSCDPTLIGYCQEAAQILKPEEHGYVIHTGAIFSKQTLSSEMVGEFGMRPEERRVTALDYRAQVLHEMGIAGSEMEQAVHTSLVHLAPAYFAKVAQAQGYDVRPFDVRSTGLMAVVNNPRTAANNGRLSGISADGKTLIDDSIKDGAVNNLLSFALEVAVVTYRHDVLRL